MVRDLNPHPKLSKKLMVRQWLIIVLAFSCLWAARGVETWSDPQLPVKDGIEIWLDGSRQREAVRERGLRPVMEAAPIPIFADGSGHRRDFVQHVREAMPQYGSRGPLAWVRLDGKDDFLALSEPGLRFTNLTVFLVGTPRTNSGVFRCFFAAAKAGQNDYTSGINVDLGPGPGVTFSSLNVEGAGAGGIVNLIQERTRLGVPRVLTLTSGMGKDGVKLFAQGKFQGARDRGNSVIHTDSFLLGARLYSNSAEPPHASGFFGGDIAEFLVYGRVLSESERQQVEGYLRTKYGPLFATSQAAENGAFDPLAPVMEPPAVQVFLPGFASRELPVKLPNINGVKYRPDGKLVALGYNGNIHLLSDTDGDGVEDKVEAFWATNSLRAPIGMALTPPGYRHGQGVFVAAKGKVSLIVDTNGDDRADKEMVIAEGWKELSHGVDALGVAVDAEGAVYFGLGVADFTNPYLVDRATGQSRFDLKGERGTILKIASDLKSREMVCTGIRFPVALAFNAKGDLFCTDQEGATWLPNGNPLDELLHILPNRHYGFPPRHPKYLPDVIDEPSTFDYGPQHQSLCGLNFNPSGEGAKPFGPRAWAGDALLAGYSRGKLYRTKLVSTPAGYVAESQLIAALNMLAVDACVSPRGDLIVATHSGQPDWGSGPTGAGKLFQIRYAEPDAPQPLRAWAASLTETRIEFDRPLSAEQARQVVQEAAVVGGKYIVAGERFESLRPGYQVVQDQLAAERFALPVLSSQLTTNRRVLLLETARRSQAIAYAVTLGSFAAANHSQTVTQHQKIDLAYALAGVEATWSGDNETWAGWLPHFDLEVARTLAAGSGEYAALWSGLAKPGSLTLRSQLNLWQMLRSAVQPGSKIDYELPPEEVTLTFGATGDFSLKSPAGVTAATRGAEGMFTASIKTMSRSEWLPIELTLKTGGAALVTRLSWHTSEDARPRALPLHRLILPWAAPDTSHPSETTAPLPPELAKANWLKGRRVFFGEKAACSTCHRIRGEGHLVGPDLSNLIHRDFRSVLKDVVTPNATINPDHVGYQVELKNGESVSGVLQRETPGFVTLAQAGGKTVKIPRQDIASMNASSLSLMPEGLLEAIGAEALNDLMKFLLTSPIEPTALQTEAPFARAGSELPALEPADVSKPLRVLLVSGPKDHGPDEHDYPLWQQRWSKLLPLADNVTVSTASGFPSREALQNADVAVFYSNNPGWSAVKAADLEAFQQRGGGLVYVHFAVDGHGAVRELGDRIGLAWRSGRSKFRHGPLDLALDSTHPIMRGMSKVHFYDESYWDLEGDARSITVLATGVEEEAARPLMWTREHGAGRVFVSILGHYMWTFDDPVFRLMLLRGMCWAAHQPVDRLSELATIGARLSDGKSAEKE